MTLQVMTLIESSLLRHTPQRIGARTVPPEMTTGVKNKMARVVLRVPFSDDRHPHISYESWFAVIWYDTDIPLPRGYGYESEDDGAGR
jgi:hypothetical protein